MADRAKFRGHGITFGKALDKVRGRLYPRIHFGDGLSDAPAPGPTGPDAATLIAWARERRRKSA